MSGVTDFIQRCIAVGMPLEWALEAGKQLEAAPPKIRSKGAARQARYAERQRQKASETSESDDSDDNDAVLSETKGFPKPFLKTQPISSTPSPPLGAHGSSEGRQIGEALAAYNEVAAEIGLPLAKTLTADRRKRLKARLAEHGPDGWRAAMIGLRAPFCSGDNDRSWKANLDFALQAKSCAKLVENAYATGPPKAQQMSFAAQDMLIEEEGNRRFLELMEARNGHTTRSGNRLGDRGAVVALPGKAASS